MLVLVLVLEKRMAETPITSERKTERRAPARPEWNDESMKSDYEDEDDDEEDSPLPGVGPSV